MSGTVLGTLLTVALIVGQGGAAPGGLASAISGLGAFDYEARTEAARSIRRAESAEASRDLQEAVSDHPDEYVRFRAFVLLSGVDPAAARLTARAVLADPNDRLRMAAYEWYAHHPEVEVLPDLIAALPAETSEFVRPALTRAIAALGDDPRARETLLPLIDRGEDLFRGSVISALGDVRAAYASPAIAGVARLDGPLQDDAIVALGRIGDQSALETLADLQSVAPQVTQPAVSAALCLIDIDCDARKAFLVDTLVFAVAHEEQQPLLRSSAHALGVLAAAGHADALRALLETAQGTPARARAPIALALGTVALRHPLIVLDVVEDLPNRVPALDLLLEAFDMLSEDFDEEQFYVQVRGAFWEAPESSERRAAAERLIQVLEF